MIIKKSKRLTKDKSRSISNSTKSNLIFYNKAKGNSVEFPTIFLKKKRKKEKAFSSGETIGQLFIVCSVFPSKPNISTKQQVERGTRVSFFYFLQFKLLIFLWTYWFATHKPTVIWIGYLDYQPKKDTLLDEPKAQNSKYTFSHFLSSSQLLQAVFQYFWS